MKAYPIPTLASCVVDMISFAKLLIVGNRLRVLLLGRERERERERERGEMWKSNYGREQLIKVFARILVYLRTSGASLTC